MNRIAIFSVIALAVVLILGFYVYDQTDTVETEVTNTAEDAWNSTSEYAEGVADEIEDDLSYQDRERFLTDVENRMQALEQQIPQSAESANEEIREKLVELETIYERAKIATEEEWVEVRGRLVDAYQNTIEDVEEPAVAE